MEVMFDQALFVIPIHSALFPVLQLDRARLNGCSRCTHGEVSFFSLQLPGEGIVLFSDVQGDEHHPATLNVIKLNACTLDANMKFCGEIGQALAGLSVTPMAGWSSHGWVICWLAL